MHYHIDLCRLRHIVELEREGDLALRHVADAPAAGHAAHFDGGLLPAQHPGKGRVDLVAHGREAGQGGRLVGQLLLPLFAGSLPGLRGPYPLRLGDDVGVSRFQRRAQGDAEGHGAVPPDVEVEPLDLPPRQLIGDAPGHSQHHALFLHLRSSARGS